MRLSEGVPLKTCDNPEARDQNINRANVYENERVETSRNSNCSGASPIEEPSAGPKGGSLKVGL